MRVGVREHARVGAQAHARVRACASRPLAPPSLTLPIGIPSSIFLTLLLDSSECCDASRVGGSTQCCHPSRRDVLGSLRGDGEVCAVRSTHGGVGMLHAVVHLLIVYLV